VQRVLRHLRDSAPGADESLEALASLSGLSASRLMRVHRGGRHPLGRMRWLKLERAALALAASIPTADAAHREGSRTPRMTRSFAR
jgi:serine/threonine protein kinase HipA of HipAB toxin-antitoxin module